MGRSRRKRKSDGILYRNTPVNTFLKKNIARTVLAVTFIVLILGLIQKFPCSSGRWHNQIQYKLLCYTDIVALYSSRGLSEGKIPYLEAKNEYPILMGATMGLVGIPIHAIGERMGPDFSQHRTFYLATAALIIISALVISKLLLSLLPTRPVDALIFAASPLLILSATTNWDMLAVLPAIAGLWAWWRQRPVLAGFLLGVGIAVKFYPVLFLFPIALISLRSKTVKAGAKTIITTVVTWICINLPLYILDSHAWAEFFRLNSVRGIDWGTLWYILRFFNFPGLTTSTVNIWYAVIFVFCCLGIALIALRSRIQPRMSQLVFLTVACFLITGKVWSPQYVIWLIPLVALARPHLGSIVLWQFAEVFYIWAFYMELMGVRNIAVIPESVFILASSGRLITVIILCGFVIRDILSAHKTPAMDTTQKVPV